MGDSVNKYFERTSTLNVKTIYPGDIQVTIDKPKKDSYVQLVKSKFEARSQRGIENMMLHWNVTI